MLISMAYLKGEVNTKHFSKIGMKYIKERERQRETEREREREHQRENARREGMREI